MGKIYVGTSGWNYSHWKNIFYPAGMPSSKWLDHYIKHFNSVELNVTFYRLVNKNTFEGWHKKTPKNFYFVAKGSRYITHIKRLNEVSQPLNLFLKNAAGLKEKLLTVLWQLPPRFKKDLKRLETFLKLLKNKTQVRQSFEFRDETWFDQEVFDLLSSYNACLCIAHSQRYPCVRQLTADFLYLRFHGATLYSSDYPDKELREWARYARQYKRRDILAFFNNDVGAFAIKNALKFHGLLV